MHECDQDIMLWRAKWRALMLFAIFAILVYPLITATKADYQRTLLSAYVSVLSIIGGWCIIGIIIKMCPQHYQRLSVRVLVLYLALPAILLLANVMIGINLDMQQPILAYLVFSYMRMIRPTEPHKLPASIGEWVWLSVAVVGLSAFSLFLWWVFRLPMFCVPK